MKLHLARSFVALSTAGLLLSVVAGQAAPLPARDRDHAGSQLVSNRMSEKVRHELVMLPYLGVFDHLQFELNDNGDVALRGFVVRPILRRDAEAAVRRVEGVRRIINKVEVLPVSFSDDRIRIATYRAIFGSTQLYRYALPAVPSIHIIVKHGHVTLEGVVANRMDKNIAGLAANGVPGVFSVRNDLTVKS